MKVEKVKIESLVEDAANARAHPEKNIGVIAESLRQFGQQKPIVVGEGDVVLAGNGLLAAAKRIGMTHVEIVRTKLKGSEARAFALADNRSGELSEWDWESLARELESLQAAGFDIATIGWESHEAELVMAAEFTAQPVTEDAPEARSGRLVIAFSPEQSEEVRSHIERMNRKDAATAVLDALRAWE
jgi:hypothetical protein